MKTLTFENSIEMNINFIKKTLGTNSTIVYREFENNEAANTKFCVIYDSTMCNSDAISDDIIKPILYSKKLLISEDKDLCEVLARKILVSADYKITSKFSTMIDSILEGNAVLLVENSIDCIVIQAKGYSKRSITEPSTQKVIRGPKEGFTEDLDTNISLLRRRLPHQNFKVTLKKVGTITKTNLAICYIEGLVPQKILDEVNNRLSKIDIDGVLESNYIDELICDSPMSIFRTVGNSERPDSVASRILEGRIAIICNGTPFVLTVPFLFIEYFQDSEDYYNNYILGTINRIIRIIGFYLTISLPAIYLAALSYHQEMIPTNLAISIAIARSSVPFPTYVEILLYLFIFEILRESSTRIPPTVAQTVGILGALVIGQAAVLSRFVSVPLILLVSFTGITGFLVLELKGTVLVLRYIFLFFSMILGLYGYIFALCGLVYYLISIRSFGVPYMQNSYLIKDENTTDTVIRAPWINMKYRPKFIGTLRRQRQHTPKNKRK